MITKQKVTEWFCETNKIKKENLDKYHRYAITTAFKYMQTDSEKHHTHTDANNVLAVVLIEQLDKWIEDCQAQADGFFEIGMTISETSSLAMKVAYMNVKTFVENNR